MQPMMSWSALCGSSMGARSCRNAHPPHRDRWRRVPRYGLARDHTTDPDHTIDPPSVRRPAIVLRSSALSRPWHRSSTRRRCSRNRLRPWSGARNCPRLPQISAHVRPQRFQHERKLPLGRYSGVALSIVDLARVGPAWLKTFRFDAILRAGENARYARNAC